MAPYGALADAADPAAAGATSSTKPSEEQPRTAVGTVREEELPTISQRSRVASAVGAVAVLSAALLVFSSKAATQGGRAAMQALKSSTTKIADTRLSVVVSNEYERSEQRQIGDGVYPYDHLVEVHRATRFEAFGAESASEDALEWTVVAPSNGAVTVLRGRQAEHTLSEVGPHTLTLKVKRAAGESISDDAADDAATTTTTVTVWSKHVRREIRDLSLEDRKRYFSAMHTLYIVNMEDGIKAYGPHYKSAQWLVREHLYGAAQQECDHWHDDAGFINHHVGVTWQFEQALQSVDAGVSAHYWDYTIDAEKNQSYSESLIFSEDWFGPASPAQPDHVVNTGRWAFTPVLQDARGFSEITNPYGLLRSPWNTNPVPYLTRYSKVLGSAQDGYTLTACSDFSDALSEYEWIGDFFSKLDGKLHGPVHIMIGGHWAADESTAAWLGDGMGDRSQALLASKWMWRQGYVRCPEYCSTDAPRSSCACSCPDAITGVIAGDTDAEKVMGKTGLLSFAHRWGYTSPQDYNSTYEDVLDMLCHIGHPGEMFTSAAPQDPTFWPLHGNAERFMTLARSLAASGVKTLNETWGYRHATGLMSDTHMVCDWANATGLDLPSCTQGESCPGHREFDLLPYTDLWPGQTQRLTNREMYEYTSPSNTEMPYVYDKVLYWPACPNQTIWYGA